jgi:hypothetical protein
MQRRCEDMASSCGHWVRSSEHTCSRAPLHPGTVDTAVLRSFQSNVDDGHLFTADQSASHMLDVIAKLTSVHSGRLFD